VGAGHASCRTVRGRDSRLVDSITAEPRIPNILRTRYIDFAIIAGVDRNDRDWSLLVRPALFRPHGGDDCGDRLEMSLQITAEECDRGRSLRIGQTFNGSRGREIFVACDRQVHRHSGA
jgi:hypothetical protein